MKIKSLIAFLTIILLTTFIASPVSFANEDVSTRSQQIPEVTMGCTSEKAFTIKISNNDVLLWGGGVSGAQMAIGDKVSNVVGWKVALKFTGWVTIAAVLNTITGAKGVKISGNIIRRYAYDSRNNRYCTMGIRMDSISRY